MWKHPTCCRSLPPTSSRARTIFRLSCFYTLPDIDMEEEIANVCIQCATNIWGYKSQRYQLHIKALLPDYPLPVQFCRPMLRRCRRDEGFFIKILWTDKYRFPRVSIFNIDNFHSWSIKDPHEIRNSRFQVQFGVNLCVRRWDFDWTIWAPINSYNF